MVNVLNFLFSIYHYIIIFIGLVLVAYFFISSNENNKYVAYKIIGIIITVVGCIIMYIRK